MIFDDLDLFFVQGSCFFGGEFKEPVQPICEVFAVHFIVFLSGDRDCKPDNDKR